jgi:1-pyrroline-5-carboxylate dehydrogenase
MNGEPFIQLPDTQLGELDIFVQSLAACPKSGLHNPYKNPERYSSSSSSSSSSRACVVTQ